MLQHVRFERNGKTYLSPSPRSFMETEVIADLETAKQKADHAASQEHYHCYVVPVNGGYIVIGYADHWTYFGSAPGENVVYKVMV